MKIINNKQVEGGEMFIEAHIIKMHQNESKVVKD
jgi:hypothetical protein